MRSLLSLALLGVLGCATFPSAQLVIDSAVHDEVAAPVVCGPMGFRKSPLQSRWGEYVRVTVRSPGELRGTAFVNANGIVGETRAWSTVDGALVVEARFENLDPDARFALRREQPIDVTLSSLVGACEGAVFTVEQGELVPDIDERAWVAELERRGGPELAARREAARVEAEARRQAHYAAWEARRAEGPTLVADAAVREAHYAAWELARSGVVAVDAQVELAGAVAPAACSTSMVMAGGASAVASPGPSAVCATRGVSAAATVVPSGGAVVAGAVINGSVTSGCASCAVPSGAQINGSASATVINGGASGCASCAAPSGAMMSNGGVASAVGINGDASGCASCAVPSAAAMNGGVASGCASCAVPRGAVINGGGCASCAAPSGAVINGGVASGVGINGGASDCVSCTVPSGAAMNGGVASAVGINGGVSGCASCAVPSGAALNGGVASGCTSCAAPRGVVDATGWSTYQPSASVDVTVGSSGSGGSGSAGGVAGDASAWTNYPGEVQPTVASVEWTTYPPTPAPAPVVVAPPVVSDTQVAVDVVLPAIFGAMFQVATSVPAPTAAPARPAQTHGAVPLNR
ncbi:MAG: hypothetical protein QM817_37560 [Archangium sp.]